MERLVSAIEKIMATEPVDIYVNPTFLPEVLQADYEKLWTPERRQRVISALAKNGVALEINSRYRLPSPVFIQEAKAAGIKFTLGTNNSDREILPNTYGLEMVSANKLGWQNMWMPKPHAEKPVIKRGFK
jgi:hypothetical protein